MTGSTPWVATALLALLVGATLPVLYQLHQTLKRTRALIESAGPRLERTLDHLGQAADRIDRIGVSLEAPAQALGPLLAAASGVAVSVGRSGTWLRSATSVGVALVPALVAGARALFSTTEVHGRTGDRPGDREGGGNGSGERQPRIPE